MARWPDSDLWGLRRHWQARNALAYFSARRLSALRVVPRAGHGAGARQRRPLCARAAPTMGARLSASLRLALLLAAFACARATLPHDLSNFQGKWPCDTSLRMGRPKVRTGTRATALTCEPHGFFLHARVCAAHRRLPTSRPSWPLRSACGCAPSSASAHSFAAAEVHVLGLAVASCAPEPYTPHSFRAWALGTAGGPSSHAPPTRPRCVAIL